MEQFQKLGTLIENRWRAENYSEQLFPEIAAQALGDADLTSTVDPWDIIRWVHKTDSLTEQKDIPGRFGQPPITLFAGPRFYIDVYFWVDGTTSVHQHAFTGAFQVLLGSSIHSHYSFRIDRVLNEHFLVGELQLQAVDLLKVNDIKHIRPGAQYIHSLFHLDRPSATITVRTDHTPSAAPQFDYRKPYFALDPFYQNVAMIKKLQSVTLLLGMKHKDVDAMIGDLITSSDFHTTYMILIEVAHHLKTNKLDELFGLTTGSDRFQAMVEKARAVHGDLIDKFLAVLDEAERQMNIIGRRNTITGEEHRFFLALLLNVASREKILDLVKRRFPDSDPVEKILDWVEELGQTRVLGSKEPNALGIEGFDHNGLFVLECLIKGVPANEINKQASSNQRLKSEELQGTIDRLINSQIFKSIVGSESRLPP